MRSFVERQEKEVQKEGKRSISSELQNIKMLLLSSLDLPFKKFLGNAFLLEVPSESKS